jgi:hypothetical protein
MHDGINRFPAFARSANGRGAAGTTRDDRGQGRPTMKLGVWIVIGIAVGTAIGAATNALALGVAFGAAFGTAIGAALDRKRR